MKNLGYYNGKIDIIENITVPMNDRVCYFGDGVYDVAMARGGKPYLLERHLDRLYTSAALVRIGMPMEKAELEKLIFGLMAKVDTGDLMIYIQVTRGTAERNHAFPKGVPANLWITLTPKTLAAQDDGITVITLDDTRYLHCNIKTLNLLPNCMAEQFAKDAGCDTAVFHRGDRVTETAHANIHIIKDGRIITAPTDNLILPGIARGRMIEIAESLGIHVEIRPFTTEEMTEADEVFTTSTTAPCRRVVEINKSATRMADKALFAKLQGAIYADYLNTSR
ncbi:MAG: aminotransferase class IV [Clostridia bacterium]|nr:aminotransferase class IV [Clostridia bacterium]